MKKYNSTPKKLLKEELDLLDKLENGEYESEGIVLYDQDLDGDMITVGDIKDILNTVPDTYLIYFYNELSEETLRLKSISEGGENGISIELTSYTIDEDPEELDEPMDDYEVAEILDVVDENEDY